VSREAVTIAHLDDGVMEDAGTVDHSCDAWRKLESQPWRIMSIGRREWAIGF
jgi:hypothetical protein